MKTLLKNCRLIPQLSQNYKGDMADILIEDKKISLIRSCGEIENLIGDDTEYIVKDCQGLTALPAFFDLHTHLILDNSSYEDNLKYNSNKLLIKSYEFAREYLMQGYTTVRDCGSRDNVIADLRDAINEGILLGPRIISSGQILTPTESGNESFGTMYVECDSPMEMRKEARKQYKLGNDFTKIMVTGSFLNSTGNPALVIAREDEIKECVKIADLKGSYVAAHCHSDQGIRLAMECGVRTLEHCAFISEETARLIMEKDNCFLVPTAAIGMEWTSEDVDENDYAAIKNKLYEEKEKECINRAYEIGLPLGFGSDIDMEAFKRVVGYEFIARKEFYNFNNIDILKQATINSAKILGLDHILGSIDQGKLADIVLVEGKPDEDMNVMRKLPISVFKEGEEIDVI